MAQILKPTNLSLTWASGGDVLNPGDTKYATGWQVEIPPRQWFNYLDNRQDTALAHINQHGVAVWDELTEYQGNKSYVQGLTTGAVYRSKQTHINQDPELDVGEVYWEFAFASPGDFYTKVQADALYLAKASNLDDLPNTATARTNLSVYSKSETYTKAEVDSKTTVASTAQSQAWLSNTTLLTPLRLTEAFQGANQSKATSGFQKLPGGLILQWGLGNTSAGTGTWNYPIAFPTAPLQIFASQDATQTGASLYAVGADFLTGSPNSQARITSTFTGGGDQFFLFVIGH
jgi:hypothetical protein